MFGHRLGASHGFDFGATRTTASKSARPTNENKFIYSERWLRLQWSEFIYSTSNLRSGIPGCRRPLSTRKCRSKSASTGPPTCSSRSTRCGTLGLRFRLFVLVVFEMIDMPYFNRLCRKRCGAGHGQVFSPLFLFNSSMGGYRSGSHNHDL